MAEPRRPEKFSQEPSSVPPPSCQGALAPISHCHPPRKAHDPGELPTPGRHLGTPLTLMGFSMCGPALKCGATQPLFYTPKCGLLSIFISPVSREHRQQASYPLKSSSEKAEILVPVTVLGGECPMSE